MLNSSTIEDLQRLRQSLLEKAGLIEQTIKLLKALSLSPSDGQLSTAVSEEKLVVQLTNSSAATTNDENGSNNITLPYKKEASYKQKFAAILRMEGRFLNVREAADIIHKLEPELDYNEIKKSIGYAKSSLVKEGALAKYTVGKGYGAYFYGSKNWLDAEGNIKPEHMYDEAALQKVAEEIEI